MPKLRDVIARLSAPDANTAVRILSLVGSIAVGAATFAAQRKYGLLAWQLGLQAGLAFWFAWTLRRRGRIDLNRRLFFGVKKLERDEAWPREKALVDHAVTRIEDASGDRRILVCSGPSGSGKSALFRAAVIPALESDHRAGLARRAWVTKIIDDYDASRISATLNADYPPNRDVLIVFDQAEQLATRDAAWLGEWVADVQHFLSNPLGRVVLIIRSDSYHSLRFLGARLPHITDVIEVPGIAIGMRTGEEASLRRRLEKIATTHLADKLIREASVDSVESRNGRISSIRRLLPIDIQIIGYVLERESDSVLAPQCDDRDYKRLGGSPARLIRRYFDTYVEMSGNPEVAKSVLYALSASTRTRTALSLQEIASVTYADHGEMIDVLRFFKRHDLLIDHDEIAYEWAHDSLPRLFRDYAAVEMLPTLREAIGAGVDRLRAEMGNKAVSREGFVRSPSQVEKQTFAIDVTFTILIAVIGTALVLEWRDGVSASAYFIVAPAHAAWACFVYQMARRLFVRVSPKLLPLQWTFLAAVGLLALVAAWIEPAVWIISMGAVGLVVALYFLQLRMRANLPTQSSRQFATVGLSFLGVGMAMVVGGIGFVRFAVVHHLRYDTWFIALAILLSTGFSFLSYVSVRRYATEGQAIAWLALLDRR